jgi:hypothetical protein
VPGVRPSLRGGRQPSGGIVGYPLDRLHEEVAYIAYHFHWPRDEVLSLEHRERALWVERIAAINQQINKAAEE